MNMFGKSLKHGLAGSLLPSIAAAVAAYVISHAAFCRAPITTDENSYVFQANNFLEGRIARPYPSFPDLFIHKQIIMDENFGWFSRYSPGHSIWLVPGVLLGDPYLMSALGAGIALWIIARCASLLGCPKGAAPFLLLCSPWFLFTFGTLLSHTSGLVASSLMLLGYILWRREGALKFAVLAGLAWGWLFLNRSYTALWIAVPFGLDSLIRLLKSRTRRTLLGTLAFAAAASGGILVLLVYNYLTVRDPLLMTHVFYDPSETLGFGPRHTGGLVVEHDLANGFKYLAGNVSLLNRWLLGFSGSLIVFAALILVGWNLAWTPLLVSASVLVWLAYIFFWYPGPYESGPGYYFETLPFIIVAGCLGIKRLRELLPRARSLRWVAVIVTASVLAVTAVSFMVKSGRKLRSELSERGDVIGLLRKAPRNSLVFLDAGAHTDYTAFNPRGLKSDPLVVRMLRGTGKAVMKHFPERKPFLLNARKELRLVPVDPDESYLFSISGAGMHRHTGANLSLPGGDARVAKAGEHGAGWLAFGRHAYVFPGRFVVHYDLEVSGCDGSKSSAVLDVAIHSGREFLAQEEVTGQISSNGIVLEFTADDYYSVEPRVYYNGCGNVTLRAIYIREVEIVQEE